MALTTPSFTVSWPAGNAELLRRHLDQHAARFGGGHAHLPAAQLDAGGAGGAALIDAGGGVADENLALLANGTSSSSATICLMATDRPWPMSILPK